MPQLLYPPTHYIGRNGKPKTRVSDLGKKYILDTCAPLSDPLDVNIRQRLMVETGGSRKQVYMIIYQHTKPQRPSHPRPRQVSKKRAYAEAFPDFTEKQFEKLEELYPTIPTNDDLSGPISRGMRVPHQRVIDWLNCRRVEVGMPVTTTTAPPFIQDMKPGASNASTSREEIMVDDSSEDDDEGDQLQDDDDIEIKPWYFDTDPHGSIPLFTQPSAETASNPTSVHLRTQSPSTVTSPTLTIAEVGSSASNSSRQMMWKAQTTYYSSSRQAPGATTDRTGDHESHREEELRTADNALLSTRMQPLAPRIPLETRPAAGIRPLTSNVFGHSALAMASPTSPSKRIKLEEIETGAQSQALEAQRISYELEQLGFAVIEMPPKPGSKA